MEKELYNLKAKILRSKHISDQLREELANDVFEIEKLVNKTNDIHSVSDSLPVACTMEDDKGELYWTRLSIKCAGEVITNLSKKVKAFENFIDSFNENYR